ncbi:GNAT family N-acetyltransferase [Nanoarchaeota archaeon]
MEVKYKEVETVNEFIDAIRIRADVFIVEQGFKPGWEPDEDDKKSRHFIAIVGDEIVATARFRDLEGIKMERMVTKKDFRGKKIGTGLVEFMLAEIQKMDPKRIWLRSQVQSQPFYEKCGFKAVTEPFDMWGCMHVDMEWPS